MRQILNIVSLVRERDRQCLGPEKHIEDALNVFQRWETEDIHEVEI